MIQKIDLPVIHAHRVDRGGGMRIWLDKEDLYFGDLITVTATSGGPKSTLQFMVEQSLGVKPLPGKYDEGEMMCYKIRIVKGSDLSDYSFLADTAKLLRSRDSLETDEVLDIIADERDYQDEKWGGRSHDQVHNISDWILFAEHHLNLAKEANYKGDHRGAMHELRKVAALCVAAGEVHIMPQRFDD